MQCRDLRISSTSRTSGSQSLSHLTLHLSLDAHCRSLGSPSPNQAGSLTDAFLRPRGSASFFRTDTGPSSTRPSTSGPGSIIDHILGTGVNLSNAKCHDERDWCSDHRPISCTATPLGPRLDSTTKYFRLRTEFLNDPETRQCYANTLRPVCQSLQDRIITLSLPASPTASHPNIQSRS